MMNNRELFEKKLKSEASFRGYELSELSMLGDFIGRHTVFFKKIYKAYGTSEESVKYEPDTGAPVSVMFNREIKEVRINRLKMENTFTNQQFSKFIELIDTCYSQIIPLGSVVEIDSSMMPEPLKDHMETTNQGALVMIIAQKVALHEDLEGFYADYLATLWPFGAQEQLSPFLVSNMMIKNVVHRGMTNEMAELFKKSLKNKTISDNLRSIAYITIDDIEKIDSTHGGVS